MKKMKLDLEELSVETFDTLPGSSGKAGGTVRAYLNTEEIISCISFCEACTGDTCDTCAASCGGTCNTCSTCGGSTCEGTCGENTCNGCGTNPWETCPSCPQFICE